MTTASDLPQAPIQPRFTTYDLLLYAGIIFAWSTSWYPLSLQVGVVPPEVSLFYRFTIAAAIMFCWMFFSGRRLTFEPRHHVRFVPLGMFLFSTNFALFYYASNWIASGLLSVAFSTASLINVFYSAAVFRSRIELRVVFGAILGATGIACIFWPEINGTEFDQNALFGLMLCIGGTLCFCTGNMISTALQKEKLPVLSMNTWCMLYGALFMGLVSVLRGHSFAIEWTAEYIGSLLYLTVFSTILAFATYLTLLGRIGAARAGYATVIFPIFALMISTVLEGYHWTTLAFIGVALVLMGNIFVLRTKKS